MKRKIGVWLAVLIATGCVAVGITGVTLINPYKGTPDWLLVLAVFCMGLVVAGILTLLAALGYASFRRLTKRKGTQSEVR
jgi:hypothetical protein